MRTHHLILALLLTLALAPTASRGAGLTGLQALADRQPGLPPGKAVAGGCASGVVHDDGDFENGFGTSTVNFVHFAHRIDPGAYPAALEDICICWQRLGTDSSIVYDIEIWDSDGPGGGPGTRLGKVEDETATGVSAGLGGAFFRTDVSALGLVLERPAYVGPTWNAVSNEDFFLCVDEGPSTPYNPGYGEISILAGLSAPQTELDAVVPDYRAFGIRANADLAEVPPDEVLFLPGFDVDPGVLNGRTTLIAVRNVTDDDVTALLEYLDPDGALLLEQEVDLGPQETITRNLRDQISDEAGFVRVTRVDPVTQGVRLLAGDFLFVDVAGAFASGDRLLRDEDLCDTVGVRTLSFGTPTRLKIFNRTPGSVTVTFAEEDGDQTQTTVLDDLSLSSSMDATGLVTGPFGTLTFDFSEVGGGAVYAEYSAGGLFSVGLFGECVQ